MHLSSIPTDPLIADGFVLQALRKRKTALRTANTGKRHCAQLGQFVPGHGQCVLHGRFLLI